MDCPECDGLNLSEIGRCGTCGASTPTAKPEPPSEHVDSPRQNELLPCPLCNCDMLPLGVSGSWRHPLASDCVLWSIVIHHDQIESWNTRAVPSVIGGNDEQGSPQVTQKASSASSTFLPGQEEGEWRIEELRPWGFTAAWVIKCGDEEILRLPVEQWRVEHKDQQWRKAKRVINAHNASLREKTEQQTIPAIDLERNNWEAIKQAASESLWIPKDHYFQSDWVSDVCRFLKEPDRLAAGKEASEPNTHILQNALRWIPVTERLPEGEEVLYWDGEEVSTFFPTTGDDEENQSLARCDEFGITHWMPLPMPPSVELATDSASATPNPKTDQ